MTKFIPDPVMVIARVAHEANRAFCHAHGEIDHPPFELLSEEHRARIIDGIERLMETPIRSPEDNHRNWTVRMLADGWRYGEHHDTQAMTHPGLVEYSQLPDTAKMKNAIFLSIVNEMLDHLTPRRTPA